MRQQLAFVKANRGGILPQVTGAENAPRQLAEVLLLDRSEEMHADLGALRDLLEGDTAPLA